MLLFPHSLASNNLAGETGRINKSEVQGSSFGVGAKVTYEGRDMTVSRAPNSDGAIKMIDLSGVLALAASLPECGLTSLECAAAPKCSPSVSALTRLLSHLIHSAPRSQSLGHLPHQQGQTGAQRRRGQQSSHPLLAAGRRVPRRQNHRHSQASGLCRPHLTPQPHKYNIYSVGKLKYRTLGLAWGPPAAAPLFKLYKFFFL